jgi:methylated-DNA-[protein]-cysteine S-methyltransferase
MKSELYYTVFNTQAGQVGILGSEKGICQTTLPQEPGPTVFRLLGDSLKEAKETPGRFTDLIERFQAYYSGYRTAFPDKLDLVSATPFQRAVWEAARLIPYGETRSYTWVAVTAGSPGAARAAGQALARNPLSIIVPCHRVLAADGGLGGFNGGLKTKEALLKLEEKGVKDNW